jgi:outer membrane protein
MRTIVSAVLTLLLAAPALAQNRFFDLTANAVWVDPTSNGSFDDLSDPTEIDFDGDLGYGIAANIFFGNRVSAEFAIARVNPESRIRRRAVGASGGNVEMMPVTAVLQFHLAPNGFIDPYIGGGAAYVIFDDIEANGLNGLDSIDFDDDVGFAVNAGIGIRLGERFGLTLDGKYVPLESSARAVVVGGEASEGQVDISPIILSAGLSLRF